MSTKGNAFRRAFVDNCRKAVMDANAAAEIDHSGMQGLVREIAAGQMFAKVIPPEIKIGTGKLVSCKGEMSSQVDIILYSPSILPPLLHDEKNGLFPVESAIYVIEIKSRLTAYCLKDALSNAISVDSLPMVQSEHWQISLTDGKIVESLTRNAIRPIKALFAFGSDLSLAGESELDRYRKYDPEADKNPVINVICVIGRGYWYHHKDGWNFVSFSSDYDEIMSFLGGVTNTIPQIIAGKGRPNFGNYLEPTGVSHSSC
ncbi:MAG: hypothetical protein Q7T68_19115 [Sphingopyxis sp.]|nr:hypothetical protein [Sphingopyxis sp.]